MPQGGASGRRAWLRTLCIDYVGRSQVTVLELVVYYLCWDASDGDPFLKEGSGYIRVGTNGVIASYDDIAHNYCSRANEDVVPDARAFVLVTWLVRMGLGSDVYEIVQPAVPAHLDVDVHDDRADVCDAKSRSEDIDWDIEPILDPHPPVLP